MRPCVWVRGVGGLAAASRLARPHGAGQSAGRLEAAGNLVLGQPRDRAGPPGARRLAGRTSEREPHGRDAPPREPAGGAPAVRPLRGHGGDAAVQRRRPGGSPPARRGSCAERSTPPTAPTTPRPARTSRRSPPGASWPQAGVEPIVQLTCRDRNRLALQADLLGAAALGARNVLLLTGDDVSAGDHPEAKPLFDIDSIHLLRIARMLRDEGTYLSGRALSSRPSFFIGAVENPFAPPHDFRPDPAGQEDRGRRRVRPDASSASTCPRLREFMTRCRELGLLERVFVLVSVYVARSARAMRYLRDVVPGIDVPDAVLARLEKARPPRSRPRRASASPSRPSPPSARPRASPACT